MTEEVPVLIVGGSLVGMTMAMLLGKHGVPVVVVERHSGTAIHPRAAMMLQHTIEILRECGIEDEVRTESLAQFDADGAIMSVETLAGKEIAFHIANLNEGVRDVSPCVRTFVTQIALEPTLQRTAEANGADVRFSTELISFEEDDDGVTALVRNRISGEETTIRAQYMIAADGPHSPVRSSLGIERAGHGVFSKAATVYFRGDVSPLLRDRNLSVILVNNPVMRGFFRFEKPYHSGFLVVHTIGDPKDPDTDLWVERDDAGWIELVNSALGTDEIDIEIEDVMRWEAVADVADSYGSDRIFLAGDSAHAVPPYGGYGGNLGMQDAHNLAWKLAMVLDGTAGPALLDTYEAERRPVAYFTAEQAYTRYVQRAAPNLMSDDLHAFIDDLTIDLGYRYFSSAIAGAPDPVGPILDNVRESQGVPSSRAPHVWLEQDGNKVSTRDLFGGSLVLLGGVESSAWGTAWQAAATKLGVTVVRHSVGANGLLDPASEFLTQYGLETTGAVLVRPDGFVAWRSVGAADDATIIAERTLGQLLARS